MEDLETRLRDLAVRLDARTRHVTAQGAMEVEQTTRSAHRGRVIAAVCVLLVVGGTVAVGAGFLSGRDGGAEKGVTVAAGSRGDAAAGFGDVGVAATLDISELDLRVGRLPDGFTQVGGVLYVPGAETVRSVAYISPKPQKPGSPLPPSVTISRVDGLQDATLRAAAENPGALAAAVEQAWSMSGEVHEYPSGLAVEIEEASRVSHALVPDASVPDRVTRQISVFLSDNTVVHFLAEGLSIGSLRSIAERVEDMGASPGG